jgi:serine phosphatase RsbU (regulator of sigma subunit)
MPEAMATVFYGVLDTGTGDLTYANAGHPPPLLSGPRGTEYLTGPGGLMLGVSDRATYASVTEHLEPGCTVLLYSDGLVEDRRRPLDEGLDALASAFVGRTVTAAEMCATAQTSLVEGQVRADDVCLLAVQLVKQGAPDLARGDSPPVEGIR